MNDLKHGTHKRTSTPTMNCPPSLIVTRRKQERPGIAKNNQTVAECDWLA